MFDVGPGRNCPRTRTSSSEAQGLYVHVPFCISKCAYCDFCSQPLAESAGAVDRYLHALELEVRRLPKGFSPRNVFIGGGTPTALPARDLARLLNLLHAQIDLRAVVEWTCEANPGTVDAAKARDLRAAGVNRISLGAQTFREDLLQFLGRIHTAADVAAAFDLLRGAGFERLSADLMFGLPGQTAADAAADIEAVLALEPGHVSLYALSIEDGTPLAARRDAGGWAECADDLVAEQYEQADRMLADAGLPAYEISNFARPGFECLHNLGTWLGADYAGVGPAAHSFLGGARRGNPPDLDAWASALEAGRPPHAFEERLEPAAAAREALMLALRTADGVDAGELRARTGFDPEALRGPEIARFLAEGLIERTDRGFRLSRRARFISNTVFRELV